MNNTLSKFLPHVIAIVLMMAASFIFYGPEVFEGKVLVQNDNIQSQIMQTEVRKYGAIDGKLPLWTNAMFSGMPAYQILYNTDSFIKYPFKALLLGNSMLPPQTNILLIMLGMYLFLSVLGIDWRISILGAIGFGLSANNVLLSEAGHSTKLVSLGYAAPIFAGAILAYRKKYLLGASVAALMIGLQVYANHIQITYYTLILLGILSVFFLVDAIKKGEIGSWATASGALAIAALLGFGANVSRLWTTYEYAAETIRGKSELLKKTSSSGSSATGEGLSKDYAFDWSYGKLETFNFLIPNYVGGNSSKYFVQNDESESIAVLRTMGEQANELAQATSHYWGPQPFTSGPVYMGIIFFFLAILGVFLIPGNLKYWLFGSALLMTIMAWGKHLMGFNGMLFDVLPLYNKFRAVTMTLTMVNFCIMALAAWGLHHFLTRGIDPEIKKKSLLMAGGVTAGLLVLGWLLGGNGNYGADGLTNLPENLRNAIILDRKALLNDDLMRSFLFFGIGFAALFFSQRFKVGTWVMFGIVGLLAMMDVWNVDRRMVNEESFQEESAVQSQKLPSKADELIMKDQDLHYRVINFNGNPFSNAMPSLFHKHTGGYHAAKLMRYQEAIEKYLGNPGKYFNVYSMLNTKWIIQGENAMPNMQAFGNAWFAKNIQTVPDADAEIAAIGNLQRPDTAVLVTAMASKLGSFSPAFDSSNTIKLTKYHPDRMEYQYNAKTDQLAVFSEVYYPESKGWKILIDGKPHDSYLKVNFLLRGSKVPAGNHTLQMVFEPKSYYTGEKIAMGSSILVLLLFGFGLFNYAKSGQFPGAPTLTPDITVVSNTENRGISTGTNNKSTKTKK
jgi:hypothetical protein